MNLEASRVPIVDDSGKVVKIISQSTVLKLLGIHTEALGSKLADGTVAC
jgi:hypothetical protein